MLLAPVVCVMQAAAVERFIVVHGQVLLTVLGLIKKALSGCGFAKTLKEKLTERRHRVLAAAGGGKGGKGKAAAAAARALRSAVENPVRVSPSGTGGALVVVRIPGIGGGLACMC